MGRKDITRPMTQYMKHCWIRADSAFSAENRLSITPFVLWQIMPLFDRDTFVNAVISIMHILSFFFHVYSMQSDKERGRKREEERNAIDVNLFSSLQSVGSWSDESAAVALLPESALFSKVQYHYSVEKSYLEITKQQKRINCAGEYWLFLSKSFTSYTEESDERHHHSTYVMENVSNTEEYYLTIRRALDERSK